MFKTPFLFFGQTVKGVPKPWNLFKIDGVMVNAYEMLQDQTIDKKVREQGIHGFIGFNGVVAIDSGGFLFMKKEITDIDPQTLLKLYRESRPNYAVVLDYPISLRTSKAEIRRKQLKTLKNIEIMSKIHNGSNPELMPVVHGYDVESVEWFLSKLDSVADFNIYGIGSLVPAIYNQRGCRLTVYDVVRIVSYIRERLPDKKIHVFGIGSIITMHLMFYAGADSVDSSAWRKKAAFGAIQIKGVGDRYITPNKRHKKYRDLSQYEKKLIEECRCPACKEHSPEELRQSFKLRAIHNAWVYQREIEETRKLVKKGQYPSYVYELMRGTRFFKALKIVERIRKA